MTEFELIARFFDRPVAAGGAVVRGIGDDCALLDFGGPTQLVVTTDMLIAGRHLFPDAEPRQAGHKALAVNLSDLAAAGAQPRCFFLALGLPAADEKWLAGFSAGLLSLADEYGCVLAGGDTTRMPAVRGTAGPLTITITALGEVPRGLALNRAGAQVGDDIWVSGSLGDARLALEIHRGGVRVGTEETVTLRKRLDWPTPRVPLGIALRGLATACIDVSDGFVGDLGHVLARSGVGATVEWANIPRNATLRLQSDDIQLRCALAGGDDYELVFTAPPSRRVAVAAAAAAVRTPVTRVGVITEGRDLIFQDAVGKPMDMPFKAYDHFGSHDPEP